MITEKQLKQILVDTKPMFKEGIEEIQKFVDAEDYEAAAEMAGDLQECLLAAALSKSYLIYKE